MAVTVVLQKHILEEFVLHNELIDQKNLTLQIKPEIRFQVFPQKDKNPIATELSVEMGNMDDGSPLYIKLRLRGMFLTVAEKENEKIDATDFHKQALILLFETARTMISGVTLMGGMKPFCLPPINPANINVQKTN